MFSENKVHFFAPSNQHRGTLASTKSTLAPPTMPPPPANPSPVIWTSSEDAMDITTLTLDIPDNAGLVKQIVWHPKGDYLTSVCESRVPYPYFTTQVQRFFFISWYGTRDCVDAPDFQEAFSSTLFQSPRFCAVRAVPPLQTAFFRCGE